MKTTHLALLIVIGVILSLALLSYTISAKTPREKVQSNSNSSITGDVILYPAYALHNALSTSCSDIQIDSCSTTLIGGDNSVPWTNTELSVQAPDSLGRAEKEFQGSRAVCTFKNLGRYKSVSYTVSLEWNVENIEPHFFDNCIGSFDGVYILPNYGPDSGVGECTIDETTAFCGANPTCTTYDCTYATKFQNLHGSASESSSSTANTKGALAPFQFIVSFINGLPSLRSGLYNNKLLSPVCKAQIDFTSCELWSNNAPEVILVSDKATANTDEIINFTAIATDSDPSDMVVQINTQIIGGTGTGSPIINENCLLGQIFPCVIKITIPKEYTNVNDTIVVNVSVFDGYEWSNNASESIYIYNRPPKVNSVNVTDYFKIYNQSDIVSYEDIFDNDAECSFNVSDLDLEHANLKVFYNITLKSNGKQYLQTPPYDQFRTTESITGYIDATSGVKATIKIPAGKLYPKDTVTCIINVTDIMGASAEDKAQSEMPSFNLKTSDDYIHNVVESPSLIAEKNLIGRVKVTFTSNLIDKISKPFPSYMNIKEGAYNHIYQKSATPAWPDTEKYSIEYLRDHPLEILSDGTRAASKMLQVKRAEDTVNFDNIIPLPSKGNAQVRGWTNTAVFSTPDGDWTKEGIRDEDDTDNEHFIRYEDVYKQIKDFKIVYVVFLDSAELAGKSGETIDNNIQFVKSALPLVPAKVKITSIVYLAPSVFAAGTSPGNIRDALVRTVEAYRLATNSDLGVGVIITRAFMSDGAGGILDGVSWKKIDLGLGMSWDGYKSILIRNEAPYPTQAHEMEHVFAGLGDGYSGGFFGHAGSEPGWCFGKCFPGSPQRINIYYKPNPEFSSFSLKEEYIDVPEYNDRVLTELQSLGMGRLHSPADPLYARFFELVGRGTETWITDDEYRSILNEFLSRGYLQ